MMKTESELIDQMLRDGGAIVGSDSCNTIEIAIARRCGLFALRGDCGLVLKPKGWVAAAKEGIALRLAEVAMGGPAASCDEEIARQANAGTLGHTMEMAQLRAENRRLRDALECARGGLCSAAITDGTLEMVEAALALPNNTMSHAHSNNPTAPSVGAASETAGPA